MKRMIEFSQHAGVGEADLAQSREGAASDAGFDALVRRQSRFVYRVAYSILRNTHDAEDATQESFLKLYRNGAWRKMRDERAYLARIAWRMAIDRLSKREPATAQQEVPSGLATPEQLALSADWNATVHKLIDALPEELRQPLALSTVDRLNSSQIAQVLGIPDGTVRNRLMRARQVLKTKLTVLTGRERHGK